LWAKDKNYAIYINSAHKKYSSTYHNFNSVRAQIDYIVSSKLNSNPVRVV